MAQSSSCQSHDEVVNWTQLPLVMMFGSPDSHGWKWLVSPKTKGILLSSQWSPVWDTDGFRIPIHKNTRPGIWALKLDNKMDGKIKIKNELK